MSVFLPGTEALLSQLCPCRSVCSAHYLATGPVHTVLPLQETMAAPTPFTVTLGRQDSPLG